MLLEIKNVSKFYANHTALNDVNFSVPEGGIFGLLGPNGAGKTSLIRIITQITAADKGEVRFMGELLKREHIEQMGYLPEERGLYKKMKVGEQLLYLARLKGMPKDEAKEKIRNWLEKFEIQAWWNKNIEELSKGMQQKIQFIATVLHQPKLIILDEPFSGFDPINTAMVRKEILKLREQGSTIIFSTHRMESVEELCDEIALIHRSKKILGGKKKEIKQAYKSNTYWLETEKMIAPTPQLFEIQESGMGEHEFHRTKVKLLEGTPNDLLSNIISSQNVIHSLQENIPSMNDIFISVVGEEEAKAVLGG